MVRGVRDATHHDPGPGPPGLEEGNHLLPPGFLLRAEHLQALRGVAGILADELQERLRLRQRARAHVDAEHGPEPHILAQALVDHLLPDAAAPAVGPVRSRRQVVILEHGPDAHHLEPLGPVGVDEERVTALALNHGVISA